MGFETILHISSGYIYTKKPVTMYYLRKGTPNYMVCYILLLICQDMRLIAFVGDAILTCVSVFFLEDCHIKTDIYYSCVHIELLSNLLP